MKAKFQCIVLLVLSSSLAGAEVYEKTTRFAGLPLTTSILICQAKDMNGVGFWRNKEGTVQEGSRIQEESKPTRWKISFRINSAMAEVIRVNKFYEPEGLETTFSMETTSSGGILLVRQRKPGTPPETISIDPTNSSFVYVSQHVDSLWNNANIWHGSCRNVP
jgi:hypothetical protein